MGLTTFGAEGMCHRQERMALNYVEAAANWLRKKGYDKIGIMGLSFGATYALSAAARVPDISLVISLSGYELVFEGVDNKGFSEWPAGHSAYTWNGKELPYQPYYLDKQSFMQTYRSAKEQYGEAMGRAVFEHSLSHTPPAKCYIPVENICGRVVLIGCRPDTEWDTCNAAVRMKKRMLDNGFKHPIDVITYKRGTHLTLPEVIPCLTLLSMMHSEGRKHRRQCKKVRINIKNRLEKILAEW
ncbi:MAG: hypothetical protein K6C13_08705 [Oscillospiraceae bacterium]|nr:hypothetical protein [Oscillospiraceae bacterium]